MALSIVYGYKLPYQRVYDILSERYSDIKPAFEKYALGDEFTQRLSDEFDGAEIHFTGFFDTSGPEVVVGYPLLERTDIYTLNRENGIVNLNAMNPSTELVTELAGGNQPRFWNIFSKYVSNLWTVFGGENVVADKHLVIDGNC